MTSKTKGIQTKGLNKRSQFPKLKAEGGHVKSSQLKM
jgi:hypothetical protein